MLWHVMTFGNNYSLRSHDCTYDKLLNWFNKLTKDIQVIN